MRLNVNFLKVTINVTQNSVVKGDSKYSDKS